MMKENPPLIYICYEDFDTATTQRLVEKFARSHAMQRCDVVFISPLHAFGYLDRNLSDERRWEYRRSLLDQCDCVLTFGTNSMSAMCMKEKEYAMDHRIRVWDVLREGRPPDVEELRMGAW